MRAVFLINPPTTFSFCMHPKPPIVVQNCKICGSLSMRQHATAPGHPVDRRCRRRRLQAISSAAEAAALPHGAATLLGHSTWGTWAALSFAAALSLWLEERTKWGKQMSGALLATLIGLALSNLGVVPSESAVYGVSAGR